jgi:hypothetical protein
VSGGAGVADAVRMRARAAEAGGGADDGEERGDPTGALLGAAGAGRGRHGARPLTCDVSRHHFNFRNAVSTAYSRTWTRSRAAS